MMAHNETAVIKRCLSSVRYLIDEYLIQTCEEDDQTAITAKELLDSWGKTGHIIHRAWKNFGYNKSTLKLQSRARLSTDYLIFLDAKETLVMSDRKPITLAGRKILEDEIRANLDVNVFFTTTECSGGTSVNSRWNIVKNDRLWMWKYPIHEQLRSSQPSKEYNLKSVINFVRRDGESGTSKAKYVYYTSLCLEYLETAEPSDKEGISHCTHYAAQSYADSGDTRNALVWYLKYIDLKTGDGYEYISRCKSGWYTRAFGNKEKGEELYLGAVKQTPHLVLAYYDLCQHYIEDKRYEEAIVIGEKGLASYVNTGRHLFEDISVARWRLRYQIGLAYFYSGKKREALICFKMIKDPEDKVLKQIALCK